jgi:plasmid stabilization system protein ParE
MSARARAAVRRIDEWWQEERPEAPASFVDELEEILELLRSAPEMGKLHGSLKNRPLYRVLLEKTRYHVYYVILDHHVEVVTVWGASRGRQPRFGKQ